MAFWGKKGIEGLPTTTVAGLAEPVAPSLGAPAIQKETVMAMNKREEELARGGEVNAVLGRGTEFEGKLTFEGEVRIAGKFNGEIFSKDRLQIDDTAKITAEISAGTVVVYGEVVGNIKAAQHVELKANARIKGNIETPSLVVERGVIFEGCSKMDGVGRPPAAPLSAPKPLEEKKS